MFICNLFAHDNVTTCIFCCCTSSKFALIVFNNSNIIETQAALLLRFLMFLHQGAMSPDYLEQEEPVVYSTPAENPRLASFLLGMVPPLYIALYIIAYLGCYKSPSSVAGHGRFGANMDMETE